MPIAIRDEVDTTIGSSKSCTAYNFDRRNAELLEEVRGAQAELA